uniref:Putative copper radical oxidase n=1 Tax=Moniliophthora roreri TaxID=221103 RepID=A0A0W0F5Z2_MONRR
MAILLPVALALTLIPFTTASTHIRSTNLRHRRQSIPTQLPGNWTHQGCYSDNVGGRSLNAAAFTSNNNMTIENCIAFCDSKNLVFAGVEFGDECYCDNNILNGGAKVAATDCNMPCSGSSRELCGAGNRLNVFWSGKTPPPPPSIPAKVAMEVLAHLRTEWPWQTQLRLRSVLLLASKLVIVLPELNSPPNAIVTRPYQMYCGGPNRLTLYNYTGTDLPPITAPGGGGGGGGGNSVSPISSGLPGTWKYAACYVDNAHGRIFEFEQTPSPQNTIQSCVATCQSKNFTVAGTEFGTECYCGNRLVNGAVTADESTCNMGCAGNATQACGGPNRLSVYSSNTTVTTLPIPVALNSTLPGEWTYAGCHTDTNTRVLPWQIIWPTNNTVEACLNQCHAFGYTAAGLDVVVPLIATLGINNKVTFLEKGGTSEFENSTGAYEFDPSLAHNFSAAYREMHVKTDVFCAGSIILPDKAGRQINVGGWSLDSTFGVRLYTPDGVPGVNGTNDWEEDGKLLKLQRGRWYPTAAMLPNGSILIVGGEIGSNDKPQPNLEILPKPEGGDTVLELDWLARTDPWNLYPFITILPSGHVFIAYYNEARILDAKTFETIKTLPNIPAAVNNFDGGRTYPLEGSMMLFPQHAPYNQPLRVILCGGSTPGPAHVLDNCVSIEPEAANPTWTIERMPSRRVLSCMVALPDGTFMILNGAKEGVAGFGLASDPNLNAVLYDPTLPIGQRFSILNNTIVPRMYHSEAILLADGRVLVSGSDPQTPGFDEEMRVEVYIPPYLNEGRTQPEYTLPNHDWAYGGSYTITNVKLHHGTTSTLRVSLVAGMSST